MRLDIRSIPPRDILPRLPRINPLLGPRGVQRPIQGVQGFPYPAGPDDCLLRVVVPNVGAVHEPVPEPEIKIAVLGDAGAEFVSGFGWDVANSSGHEGRVAGGVGGGSEGLGCLTTNRLEMRR